MDMAASGTAGCATSPGAAAMGPAEAGEELELHPPTAPAKRIDRTAHIRSDAVLIVRSLRRARSTFYNTRRAISTGAARSRHCPSGAHRGALLRRGRGRSLSLRARRARVDRPLARAIVRARTGGREL